MNLPIKITFGKGARPSWWRHKADWEIGGIRTCASRLGGCPQVYTFLEFPVEITPAWQFFIRAINHIMEVRHVAAILGFFRAFANGTGFGDPTDPRANWLLRESLTSPNPQFDKTRTCARSVMTGVVRGESLLVDMLDGRNPPPLKPGRRHPVRVEDANIDDYLYTPYTHPHYFFVANNVKPDGSTVPFSDDGGVYDWIGDGRPVTFLPHVSPGPVLYPLSRLVRLPDAAPQPSPYQNR